MGRVARRAVLERSTFWFTNFEKQKFNIATGDTGLRAESVLPDMRHWRCFQGGKTSPVESGHLKVASHILWPASLLTGTSPGGIQNAAPEFGYSYNGVAKVDHTFNAKQSIYGRAFLGQGNQTAPVGTTDINPVFF